MKVKFETFDTYLCGDGCCTLYDETYTAAVREVTSEQLERLQKEVEGNRSEKFWTEDFGIEGEDVGFYWFNVI